jgi:hypothetical protein
MNQGKFVIIIFQIKKISWIFSNVLVSMPSYTLDLQIKFLIIKLMRFNSSYIVVVVICSSIEHHNHDLCQIVESLHYVELCVIDGMVSCHVRYSNCFSNKVLSWVWARFSSKFKLVALIQLMGNNLFLFCGFSHACMNKRVRPFNPCTSNRLSRSNIFNSCILKNWTICWYNLVKWG